MGIGIDDIISHYADSQTSGLSVAQLYAFLEDTHLTEAAAADVEALLQAVQPDMQWF